MICSECGIRFGNTDEYYGHEEFNDGISEFDDDGYDICSNCLEEMRINAIDI